MQGLGIVLFSIVLAVLYGLVHDQITVRVCLEYFTIGHPPLVHSTSATLIALGWGVVATWWMGLILGLVFWPVLRAGSRPKLTWRALARPGLALLLVMGVAALGAGLVGRALAESGKVGLVGSWAECVPPDRHVAFLTALWAHNASYLVGALGGVVVAVLLWRRRGRLARDAGQGAVLVLLLVAALGLGGCLEQRIDVRLELDGKGAFTQRSTLDRGRRDALLRQLTLLHGAKEAPEILPFADPLHPQWIKARARGVEGVTLGHVERSGPDAKPTTVIEATFDSLEAAARADLFFPAAVRLERFLPEKGADPRWRLTIEDPWCEAASRKDGMLGGRPFAEVFDTIRSPGGSLLFERTLHLPTRVLSTNAALGSDGRSVTWGQNVADIEAKRHLRLIVIFENAKELQLTPFRHRPDPESLMERALEAPPGVTAPESKRPEPKPASTQPAKDAAR